MKYIVIVVLFFTLMLANNAYAHKLISHDDSHRDYENALQIPDHKISWAIYENLAEGEAKYYTFDALQGDSFYASIVIPKLNGLEEYSPTMFLINGESLETDNLELQRDVKKIPYEGQFPGREFYEPFGQVTYWERQEIKMDIPVDGQYFIVVADEKDQSGKYSLAIGTIEDFSGEDFFVLLPKAWFETKVFFNDYAAIGIFFAFLIGIPVLIILAIFRKKFKVEKSKILK